MNKEDILTVARSFLISKQQDIQQMVADLQDGLANDTKSSAGDKYETSRAMSQQELDKLHVQQQEISRQLALIPQLESRNTADRVQNGSIVETNKGVFFIGLPIGALTINNSPVFCIGSTAPLAQQFIGCHINQQITLNNNVFQILSIR